MKLFLSSLAALILGLGPNLIMDCCCTQEVEVVEADSDCCSNPEPVKKPSPRPGQDGCPCMVKADNYKEERVVLASNVEVPKLQESESHLDSRSSFPIQKDAAEPIQPTGLPKPIYITLQVFLI